MGELIGKSKSSLNSSLIYQVKSHVSSLVSSLVHIKSFSVNSQVMFVKSRDKSHVLILVSQVNAG